MDKPRRRMSKEEISLARSIAPKLKQSGMTYQQIGDILSVSRQRAQQLLRPSDDVLTNLWLRSNGECERCGKPSKKLDAHHHDYMSDPKEILCPSCHSKADQGEGTTGETIRVIVSFPIQLADAIRERGVRERRRFRAEIVYLLEQVIASEGE